MSTQEEDVWVVPAKKLVPGDKLTMYKKGYLVVSTSEPGPCVDPLRTFGWGPGSMTVKVTLLCDDGHLRTNVEYSSSYVFERQFLP